MDWPYGLAVWISRAEQGIRIFRGMDATLLLLAVVAVLAAAVAYMAGRRQSGSTDEGLGRIFQAQSELSGRMQQSESSLN